MIGEKRISQLRINLSKGLQVARRGLVTAEEANSAAVVPGVSAAGKGGAEEITLRDKVGWDLTGGGAECQAKEPAPLF